MLSDSAVRSVQRALDILELLADGRQGLTLTEFAARLDVPKSSVHALLHTLRRRGYISQDSGAGTFHLGLRLWELDWDCDFPVAANWDEGAKPYLAIFLTLRCSLA